MILGILVKILNICGLDNIIINNHFCTNIAHTCVSMAFVRRNEELLQKIGFGGGSQVPDNGK